MGCCVSSESHPPYTTHGNASSRNAIISSQPNPNPINTRLSTAPQPNPRTPDRAPGVKPNKNLKHLVWESRDRTWTRSQIDQERDDFFFTRVTGRPEVWQTIKTALEVIWQDGDAADQDGGLKTAQVILNAASITLPHSTLDRGVYDMSGAFYAIPQYVVCDPTNLVAEGPKDEEGNNPEEEEEEEDPEEIQRRREEKGKGVADPENTEIILKARRSDAGHRDLVITAGKKDTVRQLLRKFNESGALTPPKRVQLYYRGQLLKEDRTLVDQKWSEGDVLTAFIHG